MGLWAGGLWGWASGGRWGEVVLRITGESEFDGFMGLMWAMVSAALGRLGAMINGAGWCRNRAIGFEFCMGLS